MRYQNVSVASVAYVLPPHVVTSEAIEQAIAPTLQRLGISRGIIENLTGVRERRYFDPGVQPSQAAGWAGQRALEMAGIAPERVQVLINGSVSRDYIEPATAALVSGDLGLSRRCLHMDVSNACLGFLNGMMVIANMIELGQIDVGLVVCGETARPGVTATLERLRRPDATSDMFRDNFATLTLGSGAAGAVLCRRDLSPTRHVLHGVAYGTDTSHSRLCLATPTEMRVDPPEDGATVRWEAYVLVGASERRELPEVTTAWLEQEGQRYPVTLGKGPHLNLDRRNEVPAALLSG